MAKEPKEDPKVEAPPARPPFHINPDKVRLAEQAANRWVAVVPSGTEVSDLDLRPDPFDLIVNTHYCRLSRGDDIRAWTADERRVFDLIVVRVADGRAWCRVTQCVEVPTFEGRERPGLEHVPAGYEIVESTVDDSQEGWLIWRTEPERVLMNGGNPIFDHVEAVAFIRRHTSVTNPAKAK